MEHPSFVLIYPTNPTTLIHFQVVSHSAQSSEIITHIGIGCPSLDIHRLSACVQCAAMETSAGSSAGGVTEQFVVEYNGQLMSLVIPRFLAAQMIYVNVFVLFIQVVSHGGD